MNGLLPMALGLSLAIAASVAAERAHAAKIAAVDACQTFGFVPHTHDYAVCRGNVRHYWSTGPCRDDAFALAHRGYCHLYPPHDF